MAVLLFQEVTDMPRRHIGQLTKDLVTLLLVEGEGLKTGGFQMVVANALALGVQLHGAEQVAAPASLADGIIDPETLDMEPAPFYFPQNTASHTPFCILDKAGDPLALQLAGDGLVETVQAIAQGLELMVLGWLWCG